MDPIERHRKGVAWWLFGVSAMVLGMIAVGGLTRLTESGLSMVDWRPLMGVVPPIGDELGIPFLRVQSLSEYKKSMLE